MSILGRIFSTEAAMERSIDAVVKGLDKLVYTNEEKAEATAKARQEAQGLLVEWLKASSGHNLARRWLALAITVVWLSQYIGGMFFSLASVFALEKDRMLAASGILASYANEMAPAVMLILSFYFAAPYMGQVIDGIFARMGMRSPLPKAAG